MCHKSLFNSGKYNIIKRVILSLKSFWALIKLHFSIGIVNPDQQVKGFIFNESFDNLILVSEANDYRVYFSSDVLFVNGFEGLK